MSQSSPSSSLSSSDVTRLSSAFQDPQFRSLFKEYADELANPQTKKEYEEYLSQMEREQREGTAKGVGGHTSSAPLLLKHTPQFCMKIIPLAHVDSPSTSSPSSCSSLPVLRKLFINYCTSPLIDEISTIRKTDPITHQTGVSYSIPFILSEGRVFYSDTHTHTRTADTGAGVESEDSVAYDFTMSEKSFMQFSVDNRVMKLIHDTAIEKVKNSIQKEMGSNESAEKKRVLLDALERGKVERVLLKNAKFKGGYPPMKAFKAGSNQTASERDKHQHSNKKEQKEEHKESSLLSSLKPLQPLHRVIHRGEFSLSSIGFVPSSPSSLTDDYLILKELTANRPKELLVKVELPGIDSVKHIDLFTESERIHLSTLNAASASSSSLPLPLPSYELKLNLPYLIDVNNSSAQFNTKRQELSLTLPVLPPSQSSIEKLKKEREKIKEANEKKRKEREEKERQQQEEQEEKEEREKKAEITLTQEADSIQKSSSEGVNNISSPPTSSSSSASSSSSSSSSSASSAPLPVPPPVSILKTSSTFHSQHSPLISSSSPSLSSTSPGTSPTAVKHVHFSLDSLSHSDEEEEEGGAKSKSKSMRRSGSGEKEREKDRAPSSQSHSAKKARKKQRSATATSDWSGVSKPLTSHQLAAFPSSYSTMREGVEIPPYTYSQSKVGVVLNIGVKDIQEKSVNITVTGEREVLIEFNSSTGGKGVRHQKHYLLYLPFYGSIVPDRVSNQCSKKNLIVNVVKRRQQEWRRLLGINEDGSKCGEEDEEKEEKGGEGGEEEEEGEKEAECDSEHEVLDESTQQKSHASESCLIEVLQEKVSDSGADIMNSNTSHVKLSTTPLSVFPSTLKYVSREIPPFPDNVTALLSPLTLNGVPLSLPSSLSQTSSLRSLPASIIFDRD